MQTNTATVNKSPNSKWKYIKKSILKHWQLYLVIAVPITLVFIFSYIPMYGVQIAFKDFIPTKGILGSPWVGLKHFNRFLNSPNFWVYIKNTIQISLYSLVAGFPIPILLAIGLNECASMKFKKTVQMITYAPHFISTVVMVGIILMVLSPRGGIVNTILGSLGMETIDFMGVPQYFKHIYVWSGIWQGMGYSSIIYFAALQSIDTSLHEAAVVDGASKLQRIWHIDLPGILPTIIILLIMNIGSIMNVGYEKILLMQNSLNLAESEIISTYVYKIGLVNNQYSFSSAVGLFNSVINTILLVTVNWIAGKVGETSLW